MICICQQKKHIWEGSLLKCTPVQHQYFHDFAGTLSQTRVDPVIEFSLITDSKGVDKNIQDVRPYLYLGLAVWIQQWTKTLTVDFSPSRMKAKTISTVPSLMCQSR